ncbi:DUF234 domain-containing protein [Methanosarcina sp. Z-7115]|uniref:DUF234 domain-containing protein n=1 Tax=Methanosarcina baikalica TaxID=3073890 RepID=A0ABU2D1F9_9EURY|nr:DUF234 domain-containing protein [Methanosarcina sp. Z-7115]MDR7665826.1 DUF234 domain-containing protein [Methanosarcina sp. Z-7115]
MDVVALNEGSKEIIFVECKWQTLTANNTRQIFDDLKEKLKYVYWSNERRQEHFAVVAKKIENKSELRDDGMIVFDLDDISVKIKTAFCTYNFHTSNFSWCILS